MPILRTVYRLAGRAGSTREERPSEGEARPKSKLVEGALRRNTEF